MQYYRNKRRPRKGKTQDNESNWRKIKMYGDRKVEYLSVNDI
jgi:hypothetical protein